MLLLQLFHLEITTRKCFVSRRPRFLLFDRPGDFSRRAFELMRSSAPLSVAPSMMASLSLSTVPFAAGRSLPLKSTLFLLLISPRWLPLIYLFRFRARLLLLLAGLF
jgi:hypothetical protein